jgi:hypothetical protein
VRMSLERSVWGATIGSDPTTERETATGSGLGGKATCCCGERKQDLGERSSFGDEVGVIGEVLVWWCGREGWYYQEKEFQAGGVEVRIGWAMGLWGPGEGWSDPRDADGRACRSRQRSSPLLMR